MIHQSPSPKHSDIPMNMPSRVVRGLNTEEDNEGILEQVSSFPIREDQAGMTPEQRKIVNEIMDKVFAQMEAEGMRIKPKGGTWTTRT